MNGLRIYTGMDMRNQTHEFMNANFGKTGSYYYWISLGIDERPVRARRRDNLLAGSDGLNDVLAHELQPLVDKVSRHFETTCARGRTATLEGEVLRFLIDHSLAGQSPSLTLRVILRAWLSTC